MFKPPYWLYDNIKLYDESIEKLRSNLSEIEVYNNCRTSYHMKDKEVYPTSFVNERYNTIVENLVKSVGMFYTSTYRYKFWAQLYNKGDFIGEHNHLPADLSWVHFLDVPEKKCFRFTDTKGNTLVPDEQSNGDFICFPSWASHETIPTDEQRLIVAGNIEFNPSIF